MLSRRPAGRPLPATTGGFQQWKRRVFQARGNTDIRCLWVLPLFPTQLSGRFASFTPRRGRSVRPGRGGAMQGPPCAPAPGGAGPPSEPRALPALCGAPQSHPVGGVQQLRTGVRFRGLPPRGGTGRGAGAQPRTCLGISPQGRGAPGARATLDVPALAQGLPGALGWFQLCLL